MKGIIGKRWFHLVTPTYLMLLFFFFINFGNGQDKSILPKDCLDSYQDGPVIIPNDTSSQGKHANNQTIKVPWVDPLFYIEGQLCQHVRKIFQDKSGNLWFGTNVYGLMRYNGDTLEYFSENEGLHSGRITGIVEDKDGNVWVGAYGGLTRFDQSATLRKGGKLFTNFTEEDGLLNNEIWSLIIDRNGIFWIGTSEGVCSFDGKEFTTINIPKAHVKDTTTIYSYDRITSIIEDRKGNLWFGTDGFGICKYNPKSELDGTSHTFTQITTEDGLSDNTIYDLMEDTKGNIWIGTYFGGVCMYDGKTFTNFTRDGVINGEEVCGLFEDANGDIWFAAENFGVYCYNACPKDYVGQEKSFSNFYTKEGLNSNGILSIYRDREGRFWFGGWGGLFRYDMSGGQVGGKLFFSVTKDGPWSE